MALIIEDGTGVPGSESPISVSEATSLLAEIRVTSAWTSLGEPTQENMLRRSTSTIQNEWRFRGSLLNPQQGGPFPRINLYDYEDRLVPPLPRPYKEAVAELAYALSQNPDVIADAEAQVEQVKVGPIDVKLASSTSSVKKLIPDSVAYKLGLYGWSIIATSRRMRRLSQ